MAFWRAMRASHHSACAAVASAGPALACLARDFPLLPLLAEGGVEPGAEGLQGLLPRLPDHVDLGIVGDGFQGDVRHALVDEALADVPAGRCLRRRALRDLAFLALPLGAVGEQVPGIARAHDARARQRERHAGGVDGDPAPAPLLGDVSRGARAAGRVQHQIAGVGGHENAALNDAGSSLNHIHLLRHRNQIGAVSSRCRYNWVPENHRSGLTIPCCCPSDRIRLEIERVLPRRHSVKLISSHRFPAEIDFPFHQ